VWNACRVASGLAGGKNDHWMPGQLASGDPRGRQSVAAVHVGREHKQRSFIIDAAHAVAVDFDEPGVGHRRHHAISGVAAAPSISVAPCGATTGLSGARRSAAGGAVFATTSTGSRGPAGLARPTRNRHASSVGSSDARP